MAYGGMRVIVFAGGLEMGVLDECIVAEEVAYGCSGVGTALLANSLAVRFYSRIALIFKQLIHPDESLSYL